MAYPAKTERNRAIFAAYRRGTSAAALAKQHDLSPHSIRTLLARYGVKLPKHERLRRALAARKASSYANVGPRGVWPECPDSLRDSYRQLQRAGFRAAEARAMLESRSA